MFSAIIVLLILAQISFAWIETCPNGYKHCASTDQPVTISTPTTLSNCVYDGCPQVIVIGTTLTLNGVTFKNSVTTSNSLANGGCINISGNGHRVTINNSKFINCSASDSGGAIYASASVNALTITSTDFIGCQSGNQGGALGLSGSLNLITNSCNFVNCMSQNGGGLNMGSGAATITGGTCTGCYGFSLGGCFNFASSGNSVNGVVANNVIAHYGGFAAVNSHPSYLIISNCVINAPEQALYHYSQAGDYLTVTNTTFDNAYRDVVITYLGLTTLTDVKMRNIRGQIVGVSGIISCHYLEAVRLLIDGGQDVADITITDYGNFTDCTFKNIVAKGAPVTTGTLSNIKNFVAINITVNNCPNCEEFLAIGGNADSVYFRLQDSIFQDITLNIPSHGLFHVPLGPNYNGMDRCNVVIGSNVTIRNNVMNGFGAVFYSEASANITFDSNARAIQIYNNIGTRFTSPILAYFLLENSYLTGNLKGAGNRIEGAVYLTPNSSVNAISQSPYLMNVLPTGVYYTSPASYLVIQNAPQMQTTPTVLYRTQKIPTMMITALDYFGNMALIDVQQFVIVRIDEVAQYATLTGETIKAIIQNQNNPLPFTLGIKSVQPGNYVLQIIGLNLSPLSSKGTSFNVSLMFTDCNPVTEKYIASANRCFALKTLNVTSIQVIAGLSIIFSVVILVAYLYFFLAKRESFSANNGLWYKTLVTVGSVICNFSFVPHLARTVGGSCMISAWLYNLGFVLILVPVITRVFELQYMAFNAGKPSKPLSTHLRHVIFFFCFAMILLILWNATDPSTFQEAVLTTSNTVIQDNCSQGTFSNIATALRVIVSLAASILTYINQNVQQVFPEVRNLIILCYNWFIFGGVLGLISRVVIDNPDSAFIIFAVSVLFPTLIGYILIVLADTTKNKNVVLAPAFESSSSKVSKSANAHSGASKLSSAK